MGHYETEFRRVEEQLRARRTKIKHIEAVDILADICGMADMEIKTIKIGSIIVCVVALSVGFFIGKL